MQIKSRWVTLNVAGQPMAAYEAAPDSSDTFPAVLVWMEIFGVNDHIQDVTRRIAQEGYVALALDYYHYVAPGLKLGYTVQDIEIGRQYKAQTTQKHILEDARAAIAYLQQHPQVSTPNRIGSIGFCFGGYAAYVAATLPQIAITASFYGAGIPSAAQGEAFPPIHRTEDIQGMMLCFFGGKDASIPQSDIDQIETALEQAQVPHKILLYPEADHGFFCDQRASYHPKATASAWEEVKLQLQTQLKGVPVTQ